MNAETVGSETATTPPLLEMRGITKRFPGVVACEDINLDLRAGEIHALLGENGAGKTTLMNVLYGLATPNEGEILLNGEAVEIASPHDAIERGISMVHQHFMLIPVLSVADNILLGEEPTRRAGLLDRSKAAETIRELGVSLGWEIEPDRLVGQLSVGWQQRVEILKAIYREAKILVLDEPTAVLTPQETREIFEVLRKLKADGYAIIFISHKLYEVLEIADRITVIRRGKVVGSRRPAETNEDELAAMMVGRDVQLTVARGESHPAEARLEVRDLTVRDDRGHEVVHELSFEVRGGEILGIAGVAGNGQDELVGALTGLRRPQSGSVHLDGKDVTGTGPRELHKLGVAFVPGDRQKFGLVMSFPLSDNLVLNDYYHPPYSRGLAWNEAAIRSDARQAIEKYDVRTPSATVPASTLSGGNQQKVIIAREFEGDIKLLVLDQPTRGLDVGSIEFIHRQAIARRDTGVAILLVSAELDEVLELSDRIAVMYRGRIVEFLDGRTADKEDVGLLMATGGRGSGIQEQVVEDIA
jgi:simple sugar transport system ATP-binding protein